MIISKGLYIHGQHFDVPDLTSIKSQIFAYVHYKHISLYVLALYIHLISIKINYSAKKVKNFFYKILIKS